MKNWIWIFAALLILASCKKAEDRKCFKSAGKPGAKTITLPAFDRLMLHEHAEYLLIQDSTDRVVITGGENLLNFISCEVSDGLLTVKNVNKCSFLRNMKKKVKVEIHFTSLINLHYEGSEPLHTQDTINAPFFTMMIRDGAGPVHMTLKSILIYADISHGWGDYTFSGKTNFARISARSNGFCDTYGLVIKDSVEVYSDTPGTVKINADGIPVRGVIKGSGDVLYHGTPSLIKVEAKSTGRMIQK